MKNGAADSYAREMPLIADALEVDRQRLFALQVEIFYEQSRSSMIVAPILYAVLALLLWSVVDHRLIGWWITAMMLIVLVRLPLCELYRKRKPPDGEAVRWFRWQRAGLVLNGLGWGSAALVLWAPQSAVHQAYLLFFLTLVLTTALRAYAVFKSAFLIMLVSILTPLAFRFFAEFRFEQTLIGLGLVLYGVPMALYMWRSHHAIIKSLRLVLVNEALVRHLRESKAQVEQLNHDLLAKQEEIRQLALHDPLTGLANRRLLADRLDQALANAHRNGRMLSLLFIDLDGFKQVNDELGHDQGDRLLVEVAHRLKSAVRDNDTIARLGGDEFVVVLPDIGSNHDAAVVAQKIIHLM
ncbi:MAG: diguanylate cyclase domain-containing protein, partial [Pseudonocardiaceae bacterium]